MPGCIRWLRHRCQPVAVDAIIRPCCPAPLAGLRRPGPVRPSPRHPPAQIRPHHTRRHGASGDHLGAKRAGKRNAGARRRGPPAGSTSQTPSAPPACAQSQCGQRRLRLRLHHRAARRRTACNPINLPRRSLPTARCACGPVSAFQTGHGRAGGASHFQQPVGSARAPWRHFGASSIRAISSAVCPHPAG